jgi:3,5-epimerase/4-reductase
MFLVYGHRGWIGKQVTDILYNLNYPYVCGDARIDDNDTVDAEILLTKPTHIICLIGRTHGMIDGSAYTTIDYLEQPGKITENVRDNLFCPIILALLSQKYGIHLTYMGTGCIFEYDDDHLFGKEVNGFTEKSKPNFFGSSYSVVKGFTDRLMHHFEDSVLNVRIRMPITPDYNDRNFIKKIICYKKICSVPNSMTVLPELLPMMIDMSVKKITGTINLTNPGLISHDEILQMYKEIVDPAFVWENFTIDEQRKILSAGRSNNYLDTKKLQSLYPDVKNIKDSILNVMTVMKNNSK